MNDELFPIKIYDVARETRNFEINLFWQRSNYFLVLNTAIAVGLFSRFDSRYAPLLALFGFAVSWLWFRVTLGARFWQCYWERMLSIQEGNLGGSGNDIRPFSMSPEEIKERVKESDNWDKHGFIRRWFDKKVLKKPSVSYQMMLLSVLFMGFWIIGFFLCPGTLRMVRKFGETICRHSICG